MEEKNLYDTVARLDAQMPLVRIEMEKLHTKADKIDADQRKTMVLFEDTDGKFKLVLDAYVGINKNIEDIRGTIYGLAVRIDALESKVASLETFMKEGFELLSRKLDQLARPSV